MIVQLAIDLGSWRPKSRPWAVEARKSLAQYFGGTQNSDLGPLLKTLDAQIKGFNQARRQEDGGTGAEDISNIITSIQSKYGVTGLPRWSG